MDSDSYTLFVSQLGSAAEAFPNLSIIDKDGQKYLKGILDIYNDEKIHVGSFLVEIRHQEGFPHLFPLLFEVGGEIPIEADWHRYSNGQCCITVPADEILKCANGITVREFIRKYAIGYLANHIYRQKEGYYKNGEYGHEAAGLRDFYTGVFKTDNIRLWVILCRLAFKNFEQERYSQCFCESGKKYKKCHEPIIETLRKIGPKQVLNDFNSMNI